MWPWGHAALGYLAYRLLPTKRRAHGSVLVMLALLVGTQLPDLIDKPLAWWATVLPTGRSLAHSVLTFAVFVALAYVVAQRYDRSDVAFAASFGYGAHLVGDSLHSLLRLRFADLTFLLWPVLPSPDYPTDKSFTAHFAELSFSGFTIVGFVLSVLAVAVFVRTELNRR
ncbi:metal-dependent hydrolase [Haloarchaeobius amylolyticus]|uniref:metal-dependent hydrolase n=1 Tax=Haloarchaeobius amylolyticus TaxID=1198296 RepID=UPI00226FC39E|nr:metal-dependent hydrolase [Haloarchaeobius amylolyticus]